MTRVDIDISPGGRIPEDMRAMIDNRVDKTVIAELRRRGGKITITIKAGPHRKSTPVAKASRVTPEIVNDICVKFSTQRKYVEDFLMALSASELRQVTKLITLPVPQSASRQELLQSVLQFLESGEKWAMISGRSGRTE